MGYPKDYFGSYFGLLWGYLRSILHIAYAKGDLDNTCGLARGLFRKLLWVNFGVT